MARGLLFCEVMSQPIVRQFMTPCPVIIDGGLTVADASARMFQIHARHLPVYTEGHLVGILSDRDVAYTSTVRGLDPEVCTTEQACTPNPYVCTPTTPLETAVQTMIEHKYGAVLVMEDGRLLGILTVMDALMALVALLRREANQALDAKHTWTASLLGPAA